MRILYLIIPVVLLLTGCGRDAREYELDSKGFDSKKLQEIQSDTGIIFPVGARGLNFYYKPPIDPAYIAKIEIPKQSKDDFIKSLSTIENDHNIKNVQSMGTKVNWWIPKHVKPLLDRQRFVGTGNFLHVVLTDEGTKVILYLEWWVI